MSMTVAQMKELTLRASKMHNNSWRRADKFGVQTGFGHYILEIYQCVLMVCREMGIDEGFAMPISILLEIGYCEIFEWAENPIAQTGMRCCPDAMDKRIVSTEFPLPGYDYDYHPGDEA